MNHFAHIILIAALVHSSVGSITNYRCDNGFLEKCEGGLQCNNWVKASEEDNRQYRKDIEDAIKDLEEAMKDNPSKADKYREQISDKKSKLTKCMGGSGGASPSSSSSSSGSSPSGSGSKGSPAATATNPGTSSDASKTLQDMVLASFVVLSSISILFL
jgi:uncharacterized membrane protein YgcG